MVVKHAKKKARKSWKQSRTPSFLGRLAGRIKSTSEEPSSESVRRNSTDSQTQTDFSVYVEQTDGEAGSGLGKSNRSSSCDSQSQTDFSDYCRQKPDEEDVSGLGSSRRSSCDSQTQTDEAMSDLVSFPWSTDAAASTKEGSASNTARLSDLTTWPLPDATSPDLVADLTSQSTCTVDESLGYDIAPVVPTSDDKTAQVTLKKEEDEESASSVETTSTNCDLTEAASQVVTEQPTSPLVVSLDATTAAGSVAVADETAPPISISAQLAKKNAPTLEQFFKMIKMGVPRPAVEIKMRNVGLDPKQLDLAPKFSSPSPPADTADSATTPSAVAPLAAKPSVKNVRASLSMMLANRDRGESSYAGVVDKKGTLVRAQTAGAVVGAGDATAHGEGADAAAAAIPEFRAIHWTKLQADSIVGTMWEKVAQGPTISLDNHLELLREKFGKPIDRSKRRRASDGSSPTAAVAAAAATLANVESATGASAASLHNCTLGSFQIVGDRTHILGIELQSVKVPFPKVRRALVAMDRTVLTDKLIDTLYRLAPKGEELDSARKTLEQEKECMCAQHRDHNFNTPDTRIRRNEEFSLMMASIPCMTQRVACLSVAANLPEKVTDLANKMALLVRGCEQFRDSDKLRTLLQLVLSCGNVLNQSNPQLQGAQGFKLTTGLQAIVRCKATTDTKYTLLHWLSAVVASEAPELFDVLDELNDTVACKSVDMVALRKDAREVSTDVALVQRTVDSVVKSNEGSNSKEGDTDFVAFGTLFLSGSDASRITAEFAANEKAIADMVVMFGEDVKTCTAQQLFQCVVDFCRALKRTHTSMLRQTSEAKEKVNGSSRLHIRRQSTGSSSVSSAALSRRGSLSLDERLRKDSVGTGASSSGSMGNKSGGRCGHGVVDELKSIMQQKRQQPQQQVDKKKKKPFAEKLKSFSASVAHYNPSMPTGRISVRLGGSGGSGKSKPLNTGRSLPSVLLASANETKAVAPTTATNANELKPTGSSEIGNGGSGSNEGTTQPRGRRKTLIARFKSIGSIGRSKGKGPSSS